MRIMIMGCGRTGSLLADLLATEGHDITILDLSPAAFNRLSESFPGLAVVGNAVDQEVLRGAGIESADAFVAATSGDNRNILACQVARHVFGVGKVVIRIKDPVRADFYRDLGFDVDCRTCEGAEMLLDMVRNHVLQHAV